MPDQELFDGEIKTAIEDDENLSFRKPDPASAGSRVISWANFKIVLKSLFVSLTDNQVINGIKQFVSSPTVPDPTTDLQAVNLRTLNNKTFNFIDFNPQDPIPSYLLGRMFYDETENTWTFFNDIEGISLQLGEELRARLINDTGATLLNGAAVSITGSVGLSLQVDLLDASNFDSSIRAFGLITLEVIDGLPTYAVRYGAVRELDTSPFAEGDIIYADPLVPGGIVNTRAKAPNYSTRIGICIISDAVNGIIGVDTLAFNGSDTSVNIEGSINGIVTQTPDVSFDASSGDIIATVTNEAFPAKKLPFLLDGVRYLLDTITSPQTIIIPPGLSSTQTQESILYVKLNAGVPELAITTSSTISEPHAVISVQTVFNAARTDADGKPLSYRRYNDAMNSLAEGVDGTYGLINVITNWIRLRGAAGWTSGQDATPTVDNSNIKLAMTAGVGGQLHRANLPLFDGNSYLIYNDNTNAITYAPSINLTDITETSGGVTLLANNVYYPIKLFYLLNSNGVGNEVIATRPSGFYTTADEAKSDALKYGTELADPETELNSYALYTIVIGRTGGGGVTITLIELQNNRKRTLKGGTGGGAGVSGGTDDKVRVTASDTTNSFLYDKLTVSPSLIITIVKPGANEQININLSLELNTWYVNGNVVASGNGSNSTPFKTLQEASDVIASGDTINVRNYDSDETVTISVSEVIFEGPNRPFAGGVQIGGTFECSNANTKLVFKDIAVWLLFTVSGGGVYNSLEFTDCWVKTRSLIGSPSAKIYLNDCYYEPTSITAGRLFIYNVVVSGDITLNIQYLSNQSYTIGNVVCTAGAEVVNSTIFGNITAGSLDKFNSVITGTETVSGTTTEEQQTQRESIKVPLGAIGSDHTTGTNKISFHIDYDFYLETVTLEFDPVASGAGPTGSSFIVDINVADIDGISLATILSTKLSVDAGEYHSSTAATPAVISTNAIAQYKFISIDIDQIGSTLSGQAGYVTLNGHRT